MKTSTTSSWEPPVLLASDRHDCAAPSESMTMSATEPTPPPQPHEAAEQNLLPFPCTFVRCSFGGSGQVWSGLVRSGQVPGTGQSQCTERLAVFPTTTTCHQSPAPLRWQRRW